MQQCLAGNHPVPQWYLALEQDRIIGGLGVIENDFHNRKDLTPNVCAVYTEEDHRLQGIAGALLARVCSDMKEQGIDTLYLLTDHTSFYERSAWYRATANPNRHGCISTMPELSEIHHNSRFYGEGGIANDRPAG